MPAESGIVVQLSNIQEFFVAPTVNPFSTRRVDILGETGLEITQKRVLQHWPFLPRTVHITVQLPPDQISRDLAQATRAAVQHYCADKIDDNRAQRKLTVRNSLRQLAAASVVIVLALMFVGLLVANPLGLLPDFLRGILIVLAIYACAVLSFDALWSLAFDWVPFVQENSVYRVIAASDITIAPAD